LNPKLLGLVNGYLYTDWAGQLWSNQIGYSQHRVVPFNPAATNRVIAT
jgi:hypothetical protein